jgi:hypothetical protein
LAPSPRALGPKRKKSLRARDANYVERFALAFRARVLAELARRIWRRVRLLLGLARLAALRVDLRDGRPLESSSVTDDRLDPFFLRFRVPDEPRPTFLSLALMPGFEVSTPMSRRVRRGCFDLPGLERSAWYRDRWALVAMGYLTKEG